MALPMLNQADLVSEIADETGWSKSDVRRVLEALSAVIQNNVSEGYRVKVAGIQVEPKLKKARKKRKGRNPATGEDVMIAAKPASVVLKAKPVKPLTDIKLPSTKKLEGML
jgi:nucleoid DNA-binding protein